MAKVGFRREIMGFNRNEVIDYIKDIQTNFNTREKSLLENLDKLNKRNAELIDELKKIPELEAKLKLSESTITSLANEVAECNKIKAENENISSNIANMFLLSKSNADATNKMAEELKARAIYEANNTLDMLKNVSGNLTDVQEKVITASQNYCEELNKIITSFNNAKDEVKAIENSQNLNEKVNLNE